MTFTRRTPTPRPRWRVRGATYRARVQALRFPAQGRKAAFRARVFGRGDLGQLHLFHQGCVARGREGRRQTGPPSRRPAPGQDERRGAIIYSVFSIID